MTLNQAIETAKAKASNSPRWLRAIERAATALQNGELCVTLLVGGALVTSPRGSYFVNGHCECEASRLGHAECYHRAAVRLTEMLETQKPDTVSGFPRAPRVVRSIERDYTGARYTVVRCNGWAI
jgi:hypothetical protein